MKGAQGGRTTRVVMPLIFIALAPTPRLAIDAHDVRCSKHGAIVPEIDHSAHDGGADMAAGRGQQNP